MRGLKIFSLGFFTYLFLSLYSNYFDSELRDVIYSRGFEPAMIFLGSLMAVVFFLFFYLGYLSDWKLPTWAMLWLFFMLSFYEFPVGPLLALLLITAHTIRLDPFRRFPEVAILLSILTPLLLYARYGIPLFERQLRPVLVGPLVLLALLAVVGISYSRIPVVWKTSLLAVYTVVFFLGAFRSLLLLIYLSYLFSVYFSNPELGKKSSIIGVFFLGVIFWMSGGFSTLMIRVGFTFLVFHNLVRLSMPWGLFHGALILSSNPRHIISQLFGASTNYTYFFFGQAVADFGIFGLVEAFLLGTLLRESEASPQSLSLTLSVMLYCLDSGIDALSLLFIIGSISFERLHHEEKKWSPPT